MVSERLQRRIDALLDEADEAAGRRDWAAVSAAAQRALALDAESTEARAYLEMAAVDAGPSEHAPAPPAEPASVGAARLPESFAAGRYRVIRLLGEGGRKRVYLAYDERLDREVAVAVMGLADLSPEETERVRREARAMARLGDHPGIVSVFDTFETGSEHYFVSEFMAGGDLAVLLRAAEGGRLSPVRAVEIAGQVADALSHAHERGIVHRDLKPANVFVSSDESVRLGDFGLARTIGSADLTQVGMIVGTVAYMAPEQVLGGVVDGRADLYGLGCVIYEMLTGRPPFIAEDTVGLLGQHINATPLPPSWHVAEVPPALDQLVLELLAKAPDVRPPNASQLASRLRNLDLSTPAEVAPSESSLDDLAFGPMVGRQPELALLRERVDRAIGGHGSLTLVVGEPGIGKTRLAEETALYAGLKEVRVLWGRCYEAEGASPYRPWIEAIRQYAAAEDDGTLRRDLGSGAADVGRLVSEVRGRLDLAGAESEVEPDRLRLLESVSAFLVAAAQRAPTLLILDDLHWADTASLALLENLARRLDGSRIALVGTYRDVELDRNHPLASVLADLRQRRLYERVRLHGLTGDDIRALLAAVGRQEASRVSAAFVTGLASETEGNPFFIEEILRHLVETGTLYRRDGLWVSDAPSVADLAIPEGVREVVGRRLSRLAESTNRALANAAVLGREFEFAVLLQMTGLEEDVLLAAVEEALAHQLIIEMRDRPGAWYQFTHALVQQTLEDELSLPRRQRMHFRAGEAIEAVHQANTERYAEALAVHFREAGVGGDLGKAYSYGLMAQDAAERAYAFEAATEHFLAGIGVLEARGATELEIAHHITRLRTLINHSTIPTAEVRLLMSRAHAAFGAAGDRANCALASFVLGLSYQWAFDPATLDLPRSEQLLGEARAEFEAVGDSENARSVASWLLNVDIVAGRHRDVVARAIEFDDDADHGAWSRTYRGFSEVMLGETTGLDVIRSGWERTFSATSSMHPVTAHIACVVWHGVCFSMMRNPELAERLVSRELELRRQSVGRTVDLRCFLAHVRREQGLRDDGTLPVAADLPAGSTDAGRASRAALAFREGDWSAIATVKESDDVGRKTAPRGNGRFAALWVAELALSSGDLATAEEAFNRVIDPEAPGLDLVGRAGLALVYASSSRRSLALEEIATCRTIIGEADWSGLRARVDLAESLALLAGGDSDRAQALFDRALATMREVQFPWDEAEAQHLLGRTHADLGDRTEALAHIDEALAILRGIGAAEPWISRVIASRLAVVGVDPSSPIDAGSIALVSASVGRERADLSRHAAPDGTITLMFSDIEDSTLLNEQMGDAQWMEVLRAHNELVEEQVQLCEGRVVKTIGDGYMVVFASAEEGLRCALEIQSSLGGPPDLLRQVRVRIGLHAGSAVREGADFFGREVNYAARVASAASGGEVLFSTALRDKLGAGWTPEIARTVYLKGFQGDHPLWTVRPR